MSVRSGEFRLDTACPDYVDGLISASRKQSPPASVRSHDAYGDNLPEVVRPQILGRSTSFKLSNRRPVRPRRSMPNMQISPFRQSNQPPRFELEAREITRATTPHNHAPHHTGLVSDRSEITPVAVGIELPASGPRARRSGLRRRLQRMRRLLAKPLMCFTGEGRVAGSETSQRSSRL